MCLTLYKPSAANAPWPGVRGRKTGLLHLIETDLEMLKQAVLRYLSELDNPVPDYSYRLVLRNRLRELTGAPPQPKPRETW